MDRLNNPALDLLKGTSALVTAVDYIILNADKYKETWVRYIEQYQVQEENIYCATRLYGVRFESGVDMLFSDGMRSIQEATTKNTADIFDKSSHLWSYNRQTSEPMIRCRMELTEYSLFLKEPGELVDLRPRRRRDSTACINPTAITKSISRITPCWTEETGGTRVMKRIFLALICLTVVLGMCACGQSTPAEQEKSIPTWQEQYDLGIRYLSEGNYQEAIIAFTAAIEIDPKQAPAYMGRGDAYIGSGKTEENVAAALADYEAALSLEEADPDIYLKIANIYMDQNDMKKAYDILKKGYQATNSEELLTRLNGISLARTERVSNGENYDFVNTYDDKGLLVQRIWYLKDGTLYKTDSFEYNENEVLRQETWTDPESPVPSSQLFYNDDGRLIKSISNFTSGSTIEDNYTYRGGSPDVSVHILIKDEIPLETDIAYTMESSENSIRMVGYGHDENGLSEYYVDEFERLLPRRTYSSRKSVRWARFDSSGAEIVDDADAG